MKQQSKKEKMGVRLAVLAVILLVFGFIISPFFNLITNIAMILGGIVLAVAIMMLSTVKDDGAVQHERMAK